MRRSEITELALTSQLAHWLLTNNLFSACWLFWMPFNRLFIIGTKQRRQTTSKGTSFLSHRLANPRTRRKKVVEKGFLLVTFTYMYRYSITCVNVICMLGIGKIGLQVIIFFKLLFIFHYLIQDPEGLQIDFFVLVTLLRHLSSSSKQHNLL